MIVIRRAATIPAFVLLVAVLMATLLADRVNASLLSPTFHQDQLAAIGAVEAVHDEVLPRVLDDVLAAEDLVLPDQLPDQLDGVTLAEDATVRSTILELAREALPPAYLEAEATAGIETLTGYLRGDRDDLDLSLRLNDRLRAAIVDAGIDASVLDRAGVDLDLEVSQPAIAEHSGIDVERIRGVSAPASRWTVPVGATVVVWLAATIGLLGGRAWWSRAAWMATAIAGAATTVAVIAGPAFNAVAAPRLTRILTGPRADLASGDSWWAPLGLRALDQIEVAAGQQAGALASSALVITVVAAAISGIAIGAQFYRSLQSTPATDQAPGAAAPTEEPGSRVRAA